MKAKKLVLIAAFLLLAVSAFYITWAAVTSSSSDVQPNFVNANQFINFTVYNWNEASNQELYVCLSSNCVSCDAVVCNPSYCVGRVTTPSASPVRLQKNATASMPTGAQAWYYKLRNTSGQYSACFAGSGTFEVNHAPSLTLSLTPSSPTPSSSLLCRGNVTDIDTADTPFTAVCAWSGCSGSCPACTASCTGSICTATLASGNFQSGDTIYCNMTARDVHSFAGARVKSSSVTVSYNTSMAISPSTATIERGSTQQFSANIGVAPFNWTVVSGALYCTLASSTSSSVVLTGVSVGNCTINATDSQKTSSRSGTISVVDTDAPAAPTSVVAADVPGDQGGLISVGWVLSADDGANDNDVVRYEIIRSLLADQAYSNIGNVSSGQTQFLNTNVTDATTYYYKVRACDASGRCTASSSVYAVANAQPKMRYVNITNKVLRKGTDVECIASAYDIDSQQLAMNYTFTVMAFPPGGTSQTFSGSADCIFFGSNFTDQYGAYHENATSECRAALSGSQITKADKVICEMVAYDSMEKSVAKRIPQPFIPVNNTPPYATNVVLFPAAPNQSSVLRCNYTFNDVDGDSENKAAAIYRWYINNEGLNTYVQVPNQQSGTFSGLFDKDDYVRCAVLVKDSDSSWMFDSDYASQYVNSSPVRIIDNALPQIINYADNSNASMPTNSGNSVIFNVTWIDYENPADLARLFVCKDHTVTENQYSGANKSVGFGDSDSNAVRYLWFYSNQTGLYAQNIAVKPYKYVENDEWTYGSESVVELGDMFVAATLRNFTLEAYYDSDGSATYTYGEAIVAENLTGGIRLRYDAGPDSVIIGSVPDGATLRNFSKTRHRYHDRDSSANFTIADDIYWDRDNSFAISVGDYRRTVVSESGERRENTGFIYDMLVYEVTSVGNTELNASSRLIARDNNNAFVLGTYNYFVPQYNAQPLPNRYLAFKFCIDANNDDICDSDSDFMNDSVFIHASNVSGPYKVVASGGRTYYQPDIRINFKEQPNTGCVQKLYCNTTFSSASLLTCSYAAKDSDSWQNDYLVKVCDSAGGCSIARPGEFYVNHLPSVGLVNISSLSGSFVDSANLNCSAYAISDSDGHDVSISYKWFVKRQGSYQYYPIKSNSILTNGNTLVGDEWKCQVTPQDSFGFGNAKNSSPVAILNTTISNALPSVTLVRVDSNATHPTNVGSKVTFRVSWASTKSSQVRLYVCNSSSILDNGCWDYTYNSTGFTSANPIVGTYTVKQQESEKNYWLRVCDTSYNCSNNYPASGAKNFSVNHRPNSSGINVIIERTVTATVVTCNYSYSDMDLDNESGSAYKWFINKGSGFAEFAGATAKNITSGFVQGDLVKCSVSVSDQHGFQDALYRNSSNQLLVTGAPPAPLVWTIKPVLRQGVVQVIGFINRSRMNVSAYSKQGFLTPTISHVVATENSTLYGTAAVLHTFQKGKKYFVVNETKSSLFQASRYVEFSNHYRQHYIRYMVTGKTNLLDGTYRIDLLENLSEDVPQGTVAKIYNSSRPSGWFNITLGLFNGTNIIRVRGITDVAQGPYVEHIAYVDLYTPVINILDVPSITNTVSPTLKFNVSDDYILNMSTLLVKIRNSTMIANYSIKNTVFSKARKNISCSGNLTFQSCTLSVFLRNGTYNLSFSINDSAGRNATEKKVLTVDTSAIIVTTVYDGYIDQDGVHLPSDYSTTTSLIANWTRMTGIDHYEYKLSEYDGSVFIRTLVNWTSVGLKRTVNGTFGLTNGYVYYFVVRAKVSAGGYTGEKSSDGMLYLDSTAPTCVNCVHDEGDYSNSGTAMYAYWNFTESESSIVEYQYSLGTSCYPYIGYNNIVPVTASYTNAVLLTSLNLIDGKKYCFSVKAKNENNLWSFWYTSNNITVDLSSPYNGSVGYPDGYYMASIVQVNLSQGRDDVSGINRTQLYMAAVPLASGQCNGIYDYNPVGAQVLGQTYENVALQSGYCYRFQYVVYDRAGNYMTYPQGTVKVLKVDTTPPSQFSVVLNNNQFYTYSTTLSLSWSQSSDAQSGIKKYSYALFEGGSQLTTYVNTSQTTASITYALQHQHAYHVRVLAHNGANSTTISSSNSILFIDLTPPAPLSLTRVDNDTNATDGYLDIDGDNETTIYLVGELGIDCIISAYDIDYTSDYSLPYVTHCSLVGGGPNVTCAVNVTDGNHLYHVTCQDNNGNAQSSANNLEVRWTLDNYGPNITITAPRQNDVVGGKVGITASIVDLGVGVDKASYSIKDLSGTVYRQGALFLPGYNATWDTQGLGGLYVITVASNDSLGRRTNKSLTFTVNNGVPALSVQHPSYTRQNFTVSLIAQMFMNSTFNITNSTGSLFLKKANSSSSMRSYVTWNSRVNITSPVLWPEGNYTIVAVAVNNNTNRTKKVSLVTVDRHNPRYGYVVNLSGRTLYKDSMVRLNVSWNDNIRLSQVKFSHNSSGNWTNVTASKVGSYYVYSIPPSQLARRASVGWFSWAVDMAGNRNYTMPVRAFSITNRPPVLAGLPNMTYNATDYIQIVLLATDPDSDNLTYYFNDSRFTRSSNMFTWNTTMSDYGTYGLKVSVSDGLVNDSRHLLLHIQPVYDTDGDGVPDIRDNDSDDDGHLNTVDFLNGFSYSVNTTLSRFNCSIGGSFNYTRLFNGVHKVNCTNSSQSIVTFDFNFTSSHTLHMSHLTVELNDSGGWVLVRGLSLPGNLRKTVYVRDAFDTIGSVCVKDSFAASISQMTAGCNLQDEHLVPCDGSLYYNNYTCTDLGAYYKVTGLKHSAVREQAGCTDRDYDGYGIGCPAGSDYDDTNAGVHSAPSSGGGSSGGSSGGGGISVFNRTPVPCLESWVCTDWTDCSSSGVQARKCTDSKQCKTESDKPAESRSCEPAVVIVPQSCFDGIHNQAESGIDCGGPCQKLCPTCVDRIRNQGETDVDCGGPCPACVIPAGKSGFSLFAGFVIFAVVLLAFMAYVLVRRRPEPAAPVKVPSYSEYVRSNRMLTVEKIVLGQLHRGTARKDIESALIQKGWPSEIIDKMIKLENYVRVERSKGYSPEVIRLSLRRVGWSAEIIDEVFRYCEDKF